MIESASNYLDPLLKQWTGTINTKLPAIRSSYDDEARRYIGGFVKSAGAMILGRCPELAEAVHNWQESSLRTVGPIQRHSLSIFDNTIQGAANEAHRLVNPKVLDAWKAVYTQCGAETGGFTFFIVAFHHEIDFRVLQDPAITSAIKLPIPITSRKLAAPCIGREVLPSRMLSRSSGRVSRPSSIKALRLQLLRSEKNLTRC